MATERHREASADTTKRASTRAAWRRGLLATTSLVSALAGVALLSPPAIGPVAAASCAISVTGNSGAVSNSSAINCISVNGGNVAGNVTNTQTGAISAGNQAGTETGIFINNGIVTGSVVNNGSITAPFNGGGINITGGSNVAAGLTNTGSISGNLFGVQIKNLPTFAGGVTNSGTIIGQNANTAAVVVSNVTVFSGGISNSGQITAASQNAIAATGVSTFTGGISNSGLIQAPSNGIYIASITSFSGGISNGGTIAAGIGIAIGGGVSTFVGGINNSGTITANINGIRVLNTVTFQNGISNGGSITVLSGTGIAVNSNHTSSTFAGGITNTGRISAANNGIAVTGVSNFSSGLTNTGSIAVNVAGNLTTGAGLTVMSVSTFAGGITNGGTIAVDGGNANIGAGVWVEAPNVFSNGITNTGSISVSGAGSGVGIFVTNFKSFSGGISNKGIISLNMANQGTGMFLGGTVFSGDVINSGSISAAGGVAFGIVDRISTFLGAISNTGSITANVGIAAVKGGAVSIFDSGIIIGTAGTAVDLTQNAAGNTLTLGPGYAITGKVLGQGADTFQLGGNGSGNFDLGTIGPTQQYQGFTTFNVVSGTWTVSNTFGLTLPWNVNGGTLAGTGTLYSVNVNNGGTLEPGTPGTPGTVMTLTNNLAFQPAGTYLVQLNATTNSIANVAGTAALDGTVDVTGLPSKKTYDILHTGGLNNTTFTSFFDPNFTGTLTYTTTDVLLNITGANLGGGSGLNQNQQNVANTLNTYFNTTGSVPPGFSTVFGQSGPAMANALTQLSGEAATGTQQAATQLMTEFLDVMLDPFVAGRGASSSGGGASGFAPEQQAGFPPDIALAYNSVMRAPRPAVFEQRWTAWEAGFGGSSTTNGNTTVGSNNVTASTYGAAAGIDYHFTPDTIAGFALAGAGTNWSLAQNLGGGRSNAFQAGLYGKTNFGPAYLAAAFGLANHWFSTSRTSFAGDQLSASFQGQSYGGRFEAGYRFEVMPATGISPYAAVQAQAFHTPDYSETDLSGGGFGLSYNAMSATDTRSELGARFDNAQVFDGMPLVWHGRLAWAHDWASNPALGAAFESLPGTSFIVNGAAPPADSALASAGAKLYITPAWSLDAKFDGEFANGSQTYAGTGTLRYSW